MMRRFLHRRAAFALRLAWIASVAALVVIIAAAPTHAADREFLAGADVSMLPEIERAGGVFRDSRGQPADALRVMRDAGINLFRSLLFVNPDHDLTKNYGAKHDLADLHEVAKRNR